ncbi:hypothetical protein MKX01_008664 [Papaver californicum]|nr:hypothetical protein MKX01_008664 [Papaver californicum]
MGENQNEDEQRIKRVIAESYDYENDSRWPDYWSNILIPSQLASRLDGVQYNISNSNLHWDRQTLQFSMNTWVLVMALLATLPVILENLSHKAHRLSFMGCLFTSIYTLYSVHGKPRAWTLQAGQVWFQSVIETKDFMTFVHCLIFVRTRVHYKFALIPVLCRSLELVAKFLRRNFGRSTFYRKYLDELCLWVESNTNILNILTSQAEIGLGFLLILSLLSWQHNITQTFVYWQLLKLIYHTPITAGYHQNVWANIGRTLNPLVNRYAPFMTSAISAAQRW